jgi:hypothetical protein
LVPGRGCGGKTGSEAEEKDSNLHGSSNGESEAKMIRNGVEGGWMGVGRRGGLDLGE